jgi:ERCC4 domain
MDNKCLICNQEFSERSHFWKNHKIKEADYYQKYEPRYDLLTKEQITFKSPESYFNSDFINKNNLKKYLENVSKEEGLNYLKNFLLKRKELKKYIYSPSHIELRTLCFPSVKSFNKIYGIGSYELICSELNLINRYDYKQEIKFIDINPEILIDTRENKLLSFGCDTEIRKLDVGDYAAINNPHNIFIERKSIQDFIGSITSGFDRFSREMERAVKNDYYVIILIESKINNLFGFKHLGYLHTEASADYVNKKMRDLLLKFPNIQICCVDGRRKASEFIINIYKLRNNPRTIDFQFYIDMGIL